MSKTITIEPISRIEGHAKVSVNLNDKGDVTDAKLHVLEFRGFEKFMEGRMIWEAPRITTQICGICPVSHHLAAAKACDDLFGVEIPETGRKLRELMQMSQYIHSHSLHFFALAAPDFIMGPDADPAVRNLLGVIAADAELAKKAITLRKMGQTMIERVGGKAIHPVTAIPGGMSKPLSKEDRGQMLKDAKTALELSQLALDVGKGVFEKYKDLIPEFAAIRTKHMGLTKNGALELYDGKLRINDINGGKLVEFEPRNYLSHIAEHVNDWSYLKFPYYKPMGFPDGIYRVGPLSRMNVADRISTPLADEEMKEFRKAFGSSAQFTLLYHYARLIELLYASERAVELLDDESITNEKVRIPVVRGEGEGVGVIEAPRGTLFHHYKTDSSGRITMANLIVATAGNNQAMNMSIADVAQGFIRNGRFTEGILNRVEMALRAYDPCLSCATHAVGQMPLELELHTPEGITDIVRR
ncbi:MAG: Ni/Fe hydrogenase subunit alpha [Candidatus Methanoperedens sp.]